MRDTGKLAQQPPSEQQQYFTLLLSGVPRSYTDAELLPLLQQVRTVGSRTPGCMQQLTSLKRHITMHL
jgi:hypothetical protein